MFWLCWFQAESNKHQWWEQIRVTEKTDKATEPLSFSGSSEHGANRQGWQLGSESPMRDNLQRWSLRVSEPWSSVSQASLRSSPGALAAPPNFLMRLLAELR